MESYPDETSLLDIGNALKIGLTDTSMWQVCTKEKSFDLRETADFFRLLVLLEREYADVKRQTDEYAEKQNAKSFPLWRIVAPVCYVNPVGQS